MYNIQPIKRLGGIKIREAENFPWFYGKVHYCEDFVTMDQVAVAYPIPLNFVVSFYLRAWYFLRNGARFVKPTLEYRQGYSDGWKDHKNHRANKTKVKGWLYKKSEEWAKNFSTKKGR